MLVRLRNNLYARCHGKGVLGRILVGEFPVNTTLTIMSWNLDGNYRWDGKEHPLDIVWRDADAPRNQA